MPYDYKRSKGENKRVTQVFREGSLGPPSVAFLKGTETGFPTKGEFNKLFKKKSDRMIASKSEFKHYEFAWATSKPYKMSEWVGSTVRTVAAEKGLTVAMGVWCKLPPVKWGEFHGADAIPEEGTVLPLYQLDKPDKKVIDAVVLHASTRTSPRQRAVCFLVVSPVGQS